MNDRTFELESLLALARKITTGAYTMVLVTGLSALVLLVQEPSVTNDRLINTFYADGPASHIANDCEETLSELFRSIESNLDWPYSEYARQFTDQTATLEQRSAAITDFLNSREGQHEKHMLELLRDPCVKEHLRVYLESSLSNSRSVTVPLLRTQIGSGEFAIVVAVLFFCFHLYVMCHRDYLMNSRPRDSRNGLFVNPSLLSADKRDLSTLSPYKRDMVQLFQLFFYYLSPLVLLTILVYHKVISQHSFAITDRLTWGIIVCCINFITVIAIWFRLNGQDELELFSDKKRADGLAGIIRKSQSKNDEPSADS